MQDGEMNEEHDQTRIARIIQHLEEEIPKALERFGYRLGHVGYLGSSHTDCVCCAIGAAVLANCADPERIDDLAYQLNRAEDPRAVGAVLANHGLRQSDLAQLEAGYERWTSLEENRPFRCGVGRPDPNNPFWRLGVRLSRQQIERTTVDSIQKAYSTECVDDYVRMIEGGAL